MTATSDSIERFLHELDSEWDPPTKHELKIIGSTALLLRTTYERATRDSDILQTAQIDERTKARLLDLAGVNTILSRRHGIYLQVLPEAIPFLPQQPSWHRVAPSLVHFEVLVLDVVDVVVSKLKRFDARDIEDIRAMVDRGLVAADLLANRFVLAKDFLLGDAREVDLPRYWENLNYVERELLLAPETLVDLPSWI